MHSLQNLWDWLWPVKQFLEPCGNKMVAIRHVAKWCFQLIFIYFKCFYDSLQQRCVLEFCATIPIHLHLFLSLSETQFGFHGLTQWLQNCFWLVAKTDGASNFLWIVFSLQTRTNYRTIINLKINWHKKKRKPILNQSEHTSRSSFFIKNKSKCLKKPRDI